MRDLVERTRLHPCFLLLQPDFGKLCGKVWEAVSRPVRMTFPASSDNLKLNSRKLKFFLKVCFSLTRSWNHCVWHCRVSIQNFSHCVKWDNATIFAERNLHKYSDINWCSQCVAFSLCLRIRFSLPQALSWFYPCGEALESEVLEFK